MSALTLRLQLALFGLVSCLIGAVVFGLLLHVTPVAVAFAVIAVTAAVDIAVIQRRRHSGEPG